MTMPEPVERETRPARRGYIILLMALVVSAVAAASWWMMRAEAAPMTTAEAVAELDPDARAPDGVRIRVRVLNTTSTRGLARRVTNFIRDLGYDVVDYDTGRDKRAVTTIVVHTGHLDWAQRLARGLQVDSIETSPDSSRHVDLTVLVGTDWKAPASQPFRP